MIKDRPPDENEPVKYDAANTLFMVFSTFVIFFMIQGAALFYSGLSRRKSALIQAVYSLVAMSIVSIQWVAIGYSLVYGQSKAWFCGGLSRYFMHDILPNGLQDISHIPISTHNGVPEIANALFSSMYPSVACALVLGATSARGSVNGALLFIALWVTLVYDPIAFWTWNKNGWAHILGSVDYAGGAVVHITSGFSALAYSFMLGPRLEASEARPHNSILVVIGTFSMWAGWFGFNAGSAHTASGTAIVALLATQVSASVGGLTWAYLDFRLDRTWSVVGFCSGVISGLVCITSGAGFVPLWASFLFGLGGGIACNFSTKLKFFMQIDDALDVFAVHGIGGYIGMVLTGIFAQYHDESHPLLQSKVTGLLFGNPWLLLSQLLFATVTALYSFVMTCIILFVLQQTRRLRPRVTREKELVGLDTSEHDEVAYDYHEIVQELDSALYQRRGHHRPLLDDDDDGSLFERPDASLYPGDLARTESSPLLG